MCYIKIILGYVDLIAKEPLPNNKGSAPESTLVNKADIDLFLYCVRILEKITFVNLALSYHAIQSTVA